MFATRKPCFSLPRGRRKRKRKRSTRHSSLGRWMGLVTYLPVSPWPAWAGPTACTGTREPPSSPSLHVHGAQNEQEQNRRGVPLAWRPSRPHSPASVKSNERPAAAGVSSSRPARARGWGVGRGSSAATRGHRQRTGRDGTGRPSSGGNLL